MVRTCGKKARCCHNIFSLVPCLSVMSCYGWHITLITRSPATTSTSPAALPKRHMRMQYHSTGTARFPAPTSYVHHFQLPSLCNICACESIPRAPVIPRPLPHLRLPSLSCIAACVPIPRAPVRPRPIQRLRLPPPSAACVHVCQLHGHPFPPAPTSYIIF